MNGFNYIFLSLDRIYMINWIYDSLFPDETKNTQLRAVSLSNGLRRSSMSLRQGNNNFLGRN